MLIHHRPIKTLITGKSGSGKTTYFQRVLENGFGSYWKTVFLYDWQGEIAERLGIESVDSIEDLSAQLPTGLVVFDPAKEFPADHGQGFRFFSRWAFEVCRDTNEAEYPRLLACDEVQLLEDNDDLSMEFQTDLQTGRRVGLDLLLVSQQINELHNRARSQMTERITFQHEDDYVLKILEKWGFNRDEVSSLAVGEFLYSNDRGERSRGNLFRVDKTRPEAEIQSASNCAPRGAAVLADTPAPGSQSDATNQK